MVTSRDAPALSIVYKLVELDGAGRIKLSPGKKTYPWAKQVYRRRDADGRFAGDRVTRADEPAEGEPLLVPIVRGGKLVSRLPGLDAIRARTAAMPARRRSARWRFWAPGCGAALVSRRRTAALSLEGARPIALAVLDSSMPAILSFTASRRAAIRSGRRSLPVTITSAGHTKQGGFRTWPRSSAWPTRRGGWARPPPRSTSPPGWPRRAGRRW